MSKELVGLPLIGPMGDGYWTFRMYSMLMAPEGYDVATDAYLPGDQYDIQQRPITAEVRWRSHTGDPGIWYYRAHRSDCWMFSGEGELWVK